MKKIPIILDTDIFADSDDLFALYFLLSRPEFEILAIITSDEVKNGQRAYHLTDLLHELGRDIPVYTGKSLGNDHYILFEEIPRPGQYQLRDFRDLATFINTLDQKVQYLCIGPLTNLSQILQEFPGLSSKISVTSMGGSTKPMFGRAEHNVRIDLEATEHVLRTVEARWVLADHTLQKDLAISPQMQFFQDIQSCKSVSANRLIENLKSFFKKMYPESYLHDPVAAATLLFPEIVSFERKKVVSQDGIFVEDNAGYWQMLSCDVKYRKFRALFEKNIISFIER